MKLHMKLREIPRARPVLLTLLATVALGLAAPAQAQESWGGGVLNLLGLTSPPPPDIDYRERPPLVVPPRSTLPPPQERDDARRAANWPDDHTEAQRRAARAEANTPAGLRDIARRNANNQTMSPNELAAGRTSRGAPVQPRRYGEERDIRELIYDPMNEMAAAHSRYSQTAQRPSGVEPPRRYLVEPPTGYRAALGRAVETPREPVSPTDELGIYDFHRREAR